MSQSLFRQQAVEQQGERLWGELFISQPVSFSLLTLLLAFFTCSALWYLWNNDYRRSQEVSGYLVPDRGMVDISPPRDGLLLDIQVREGDAVAAGQLLFSVQSDMVISDNKPVSVEMLQELQFQRRQLLARIALENDSLQLNHEHHAVIEQKLGNEIQQLNGLLVREAQLLEMREKAFWRSAALRDKGMIADAELEVVKTRLLEQENILDNLSLKINTAKSLIKENEAGNKAARLAVAKEILKINDGISELDKQIARYEVENRNHVYATVAGNVGALGASQGQLVFVRQTIVSIIPEGSRLQAELLVPSRAAGFITPGQEILIRYDAFPYQKFGVFSGKVSAVSTSIVTGQENSASREPYYRVKAELEQQAVDGYGQKYQLKPGMQLSAEVILDKRNLLQWLLDPLISLKGKI